MKLKKNPDIKMRRTVSQGRVWLIREACGVNLERINKAIASHKLNVAAGRGHCLKIDKKRRLTRFSENGFSCVVKEFVSRPWHPMVADRRSWRSALGMERRRLPAVTYLAWGRRRGASSYILMEDLGERNVSNELAAALREHDTKRFRDLLTAAGKRMGEMHRSGVYHRDLKTDNFMRVSADSEPVELKLIDLDSVRFFRRLPARCVVNNLRQFAGTLPPATASRQVLRGVAVYRRATGMSKPHIRRVLSRLQPRRLA
ncbi:MAG: lipopolysaccharide kinase InaA family protein [Lentisphaeria bacterium]|nr:lipopolysaccharide kinase InaA family protein [Lentisphaeria bacterium]